MLELSTTSTETFQMAVPQITQMESDLTFTTAVTRLPPNFHPIDLLISYALSAVFANGNEAVRSNQDRYFHLKMMLKV